MFDVIIHVPVKKFDKGIRGEGPAAKAEIGNVVLQADVLRVPAEKKQPTAIERRKGYQDRKNPEMETNPDRNDQRVADDKKARPIDHRLSLPGI